MPITLGSNISSLRAQRHVSNASDQLRTSFERLSSGQRINKASDDAAGLSIATTLSSKTKVFSQAIRNVNDGISALGIAQGALEQLTTISVRQRELAEQAANGTYTITQRQALSSEANALVSEFNRIIESTSFNGINLLDHSQQQLRVQAGYGTEGGISIALSEELARTTGSGSFNALVSYANPVALRVVDSGDVNHDQINDLIGWDVAGKMWVFQGNGDGTYKSAVSYTSHSGASVQGFVVDVNGDGNLDSLSLPSGGAGRIFVALGNSDGTFNAAYTYNNTLTAGFTFELGDVNGDNTLDIVTAAAGGPWINLGNGDGSFKARYSTKYGTSTVSLSDFNGDGRLDIVADAMLLIGNGDGTFQHGLTFNSGIVGSSGVGDFNNDGFTDIITEDSAGEMRTYLGNGDGTFKSPISSSIGTLRNLRTSDLNGDGFLDVAAFYSASASVGTMIGNGDGTFKAMVTVANMASVGDLKIVDLDSDGALDLFTGSTAVAAAGIHFAQAREISTVAFLNLNTQANAREAMQTIDSTLARISSELSSLGSAQSRFETTLNTLNATRENFAAAGARITDIDVAHESSQLTRSAILQQAATAVLAQANQQPRIALRLLQG